MQQCPHQVTQKLTALKPSFFRSFENGAFVIYSKSFNIVSNCIPLDPKSADCINKINFSRINIPHPKSGNQDLSGADYVIDSFLETEIITLHDGFIELK